jgi:MtN3 and saliva related transmembrane protein
MIEILGLIAGFFTSTACIPQTWKVIKTRNTRDLSFLTYTLLNFGCMLWIFYGIAINSIAIIITNCVSLFFLGIILIMMHRERRKREYNTTHGLPL